MSVILRKPRWQDRRNIRFGTIHCTATPFGKHFSAAQITDMDVRRFGQPSYHFVYELDGTEVQTLRLDQIGAHVGGHNTYNIGLSYVGGLGKDGKAADTRTPAQRAAMAARIGALRAAYPGIKILGHRDWSPDLNGNGIIEPREWVKMCPCFDVAAWLKDIAL